jgi:hypothetical protein
MVVSCGQSGHFVEVSDSTKLGEIFDECVRKDWCCVDFVWF